MNDLQIEPIIQALMGHQVKFVLIGGLAMRAQGSAHITEDADFCYERSSKNIQALAKAMVSYHPYLRGAPPGLPFNFDAPTIQSGLNFTLNTDLGQIDFLGEVSGLGIYDKVLAASETKPMFGHPVQVLTIEGLIAAKTAAGRNKDKRDLLELEELKKLKLAKPE